MPISARSKAIASLVGATLFWAGNYIVGASAVRSMSPVSLVYFRWVIAVVPLLLLAHFLERPAWRDVFRRWPVLLPLAVLGLGTYTFLLYEALRHTSPLNAALINSFNPALIVVSAALFLRERITGQAAAGLALALAGVILVLTNGHPLAVFAIRYNPGDLLMLLAIVSWTAYTLLGQKLRGIPPVSATAAQALLLVVFLTPFAIPAGVRLPSGQGPALSLLFIAVFPSVLSYLLWNSALTVISPGRVAVYLNLITVFTALASLALGNPITAPQVVGGLLVLAGVSLSTLAPRPAPRR